MASVDVISSTPDYTTVNIRYQPKHVEDNVAIYILSNCNDWQSQLMTKVSRPLTWSHSFKVPRHWHTLHWKFKVGDSDWAIDPNTPTEDDGFGGLNNKYDIPHPEISSPTSADASQLQVNDQPLVSVLSNVEIKAPMDQSAQPAVKSSDLQKPSILIETDVCDEPPMQVSNEGLIEKDGAPLRIDSPTVIEEPIIMHEMLSSTSTEAGLDSGRQRDTIPKVAGSAIRNRESQAASVDEVEATAVDDAVESTEESGPITTKHDGYQPKLEEFSRTNEATAVEDSTPRKLGNTSNRENELLHDETTDDVKQEESTRQDENNNLIQEPTQSQDESTRKPTNTIESTAPPETQPPTSSKPTETPSIDSSISSARANPTTNSSLHMYASPFSSPLRPFSSSSTYTFLDSVPAFSYSRAGAGPYLIRYSNPSTSKTSFRMR